MNSNTKIYYKQYRIINGKSKWIVIDSDYNKILDPSEELLSIAILGEPSRKCCICRNGSTYIDSFGRQQWFKFYGYDNENKKEWDRISWLCYECHKGLNYKKKPTKRSKCEGRKCCICGSNNTYIYNGISRWRKYRDEEGNWYKTLWLCHTCYNRIQYHMPGTYSNIKKSLAKCRIGELSLEDDLLLGLIGEAVVANVRKLKVISIEINSLNSRYDLSPDPEYNIIQSKLRSSCNGQYSINIIGRDFDTLFVLCTDDDMNDIIKVLAIPEGYIDGTGLTIMERQPIKTEYMKYEKFRIDEKPYNEAYYSLMRHLGDRTCLGIDDIKEWLDGGI